MSKTRFVDLAVPLMNPLEAEKGMSPFQPSIVYHVHEDQAAAFADKMGCPHEDFPYGSALENLTLSSHAGTHMDSNWHFYPTTLDGAKKSNTIDEVPLDWCFHDAFVLDLRHIAPGGQAQVEDIKTALEKIHYEVKPMDIACLLFGMDKLYGTPAYWTDYRGISRECVEYLTDLGVKIIGTDSLGQDHPFPKQREKYQKSKNVGDIWEAHRVGVHREFCNIEKLANLDTLPTSGFKIACFPIPIKNASAAWVRPIAIIEE